jgi:hypothetical protein
MVYFRGKLNGYGDWMVKYGYGIGVYGIFYKSMRVMRAYFVSFDRVFVSFDTYIKLFMSYGLCPNFIFP